MKIIFYCQYVFGVGHLFRSVELVRELADHKVFLVVGGPQVDIDIPAHVKLVRLPPFYMDEKFTTLIPQIPNRSIEQIQSERKATLFSLFKQVKPDLFIVELYPFGRTIFGFELVPILQAIRSGTFGDVQTACSLRDILVKKRDPIEYEQRVLTILNEMFDYLLIHSDSDVFPLDETFSRVNDIIIPVLYTGFVAKSVINKTVKEIKKMRNNNGKKTRIVASAGGGRSGYRLLNSVVDACILMKDSVHLQLQMFTGPFMDHDEFSQIAKKIQTDIHISRFSKNFLDYLQIADVSVSMAGYNTCMDILTTKVPALVWPYSGDHEQGIRAERLSRLGALQILNDEDLYPDRLVLRLKQILSEKAKPSVNIDLSGAVNTAKWIEHLEKI
jgi:predicted glycosyltransferase